MTVAIPDGFELEELRAFLLSQEPHPSVEQVEAVELRLGRNYGPAILFDLFSGGKLAPEVATALVADFWSMAEYPQDCLDDETWDELFDLAGYTVDGRPATKPPEPIQLYRGSTEEFARRWSWTDDRDRAEWFASRAVGPPGERTVWTALVEPWRLRARIHESSRGESEYVIDTVGLEVRRLTEGE